MYRLCRRTQRRESMLLSGSLPLPSNAGNGEKVLGPAIGAAASHAGQKTIPNAAHRLEKNRLSRIVFNVTAQTNHEVVDGARIRILVHSPNLLQQLLARDNASLVEHQITKQIAFHQGEADVLERSRRLKERKVDGAAGKSKGESVSTWGDD